VEWRGARGVLVGKSKQCDILEDLGVDWSIILNGSLRKRMELRLTLPGLREDYLRAFVKPLMNLDIHKTHNPVCLYIYTIVILHYMTSRFN
jgi:hypothetical protein